LSRQKRWVKKKSGVVVKAFVCIIANEYNKTVIASLQAGGEAVSLLINNQYLIYRSIYEKENRAKKAFSSWSLAACFCLRHGL
jgi:hypothetical protein